MRHSSLSLEEVFLNDHIIAKRVLGHDISVTDQYGNYLIVYEMKNEWLVEIHLSDETNSTYHSFSFSEFPYDTDWLAKDEANEPRWHDIVKKVKRL